MNLHNIGRNTEDPILPYLHRQFRGTDFRALPGQIFQYRYNRDTQWHTIDAAGMAGHRRDMENRQAQIRTYITATR